MEANPHKCNYSKNIQDKDVVLTVNELCIQEWSQGTQLKTGLRSKMEIGVNRDS